MAGAQVSNAYGYAFSTTGRFSIATAESRRPVLEEIFGAIPIAGIEVVGPGADAEVYRVHLGAPPSKSVIAKFYRRWPNDAYRDADMERQIRLDSNMFDHLAELLENRTPAPRAKRVVNEQSLRKLGGSDRNGNQPLYERFRVPDHIPVFEHRLLILEDPPQGCDVKKYILDMDRRQADLVRQHFEVKLGHLLGRLQDTGRLRGYEEVRGPSTTNFCHQDPRDDGAPVLRLASVKDGQTIQWHIKTDNVLLAGTGEMFIIDPM